MLVDRTFPASFDFEVLIELPGTSEDRYFFPEASRDGGRDGPNVRFEPAYGAPWIGTFARGDFGWRSFTGIFTTPNPNQLCVVTFGVAYLVRADHARSWEEVPIIPVRDVRVSLKHRLLIFANDIEVLAIGPTGPAWETDRIGWDELKITDMDDDTIRGNCWDAPTDTHVAFSVDLASGVRAGGSETAPP